MGSASSARWHSCDVGPPALSIGPRPYVTSCHNERWRTMLSKLGCPGKWSLAQRIRPSNRIHSSHLECRTTERIQIARSESCSGLMLANSSSLAIQTTKHCQRIRFINSDLGITGSSKSSNQIGVTAWQCRTFFDFHLLTYKPSKLRHFIVTFHEETLECLSQSVDGRRLGSPGETESDEWLSF